MENLNELKKEASIDNSRLEELLKGEITPEKQHEFLEVFKTSQLFLPIVISENLFNGIEDAKPGDIIEPEGQVGFDINYLSYGDDEKAVAVFTSSELMESSGLLSSSIAIFMSDLAEMMGQTDKYSLLAINPFTDVSAEMPMEAFIDLFEEITEEDEMFFEMMDTIFDVLENKYMELEEDTVFFVRDDENFMKDEAVDGVFIPEMPFNASTREDYNDEAKYLNILIMPKTTKIVYTGNVVDEEVYDTLIAPGSESHFVEDIDEYTSVWKCEAQPFYD